jgi:hypothetical protein
MFGHQNLGSGSGSNDTGSTTPDINEENSEDGWKEIK